MNKRMICTKCVLPDTFPGINFDENGVCSVCRQHEEEWGNWDKKLVGKSEILVQICNDSKKKRKEFDVLVPLSGGKDSMYVLYYAVKVLGLKTLAYTLDNGYLTEHARNNINRACDILGVEHIYYCIDPKVANDLFGLFMRKTGIFCSFCMRCIGMATEIVAEMYDVPLVFSGSSARTELPLSPDMFQSGPIEYCKNVLKGERPEKYYKRFLYQGSLKRKIGYRTFWWGSQKRIRICAWINLPDYIEWDYNKIYDIITNELGWKVPPGEKEHTDCGIHAVTTYMHNRRFPNMNIRLLTLARLIQSGQKSRDEALSILERPEEEVSEDLLNWFLKRINISREEFDRFIDAGPRHLQYRPKPSLVWEYARGLKKVLFKVLKIR